MMKKNTLRLLIPGLLALIFLAGGLWFLIAYHNTYGYYTGAISDAQESLSQLDIASADQVEADLAALEAENDALAQQIADLQTQNAQLDTDTAALQQEYDALAQSEDTVYYQTILESLTEGMNQVVQYIEGTE